MSSNKITIQIKMCVETMTLRENNFNEENAYV